VEALEERIPCTRCLRRGETLAIFFPIDLTVLCCAGRIRIALEDATAPVHLAEGERYAARRNVRFTIAFREGARNEWLADSGIALVALLRA